MKYTARETMPANHASAPSQKAMPARSTTPKKFPGLDKVVKQRIKKRLAMPALDDDGTGDF